MSTSAVNKGHVYFGSEDCTPKDNSITVKQSSPGFVQIHLGFLQYHHIYNVRVEIPKSFFLGHDMQSILEAAENAVPTISCKLLSVEQMREVLVFVMEFHALKERLVKERLKLRFDDGEDINLELNARVLGTGKGTPLLKNGIKCIGVLNDDMSEASDWQG